MVQDQVKQEVLVAAVLELLVREIDPAVREHLPKVLAEVTVFIRQDYMLVAVVVEVQVVRVKTWDLEHSLPPIPKTVVMVV
jgi:hypothetical protein